MTQRTKHYVDATKVTQAIEATFGRGHGHINRFHEAMQVDKHCHVMTYRVMSGKAEPSVSWLVTAGRVLGITDPLTFLKG